MIKHYVDFDLPGAFFPEHDGREVETRIPAQLHNIPQYCYALSFHDVETSFKCPNGQLFDQAKELGTKGFCSECKERYSCITGEGEKKCEALTGRAKNESKRILFGTQYTPDEIASMEERGKDSVLYHNIVNNDWKFGVKCIAGNWQPLRDGELCLQSHKELSKLTQEW